VHAKIDRADDKGSDCLHGPKWNAMVGDGMLGGSIQPLRRQEKGKMEALGSSSCVGASIGDNPGIHAASVARQRPYMPEMPQK
jgi:hypothetical protein